MKYSTSERRSLPLTPEVKKSLLFSLKKLKRTCWILWAPSMWKLVNTQNPLSSSRTLLKLGQNSKSQGKGGETKSNNDTNTSLFYTNSMYFFYSEKKFMY